MSRYALGIDIGGTFTDVVLFDLVAGHRLSRKELTTPGDPALAVVQAVDQVVAAYGVAPGEVERLVHATTLFSNALIERKGAKTALITTEGFRDTLEIGRERKFDLYDLAARKPAPLIPRDLRWEVAERLTADGEVFRPLDEAAMARLAEDLVAAGVTSVAVVFLHAYRDGRHERRAGELLGRAAPALAVSLSSDVAPEIREFERASTTAANAYVKPLAQAYLDALGEGLAARGVVAPLLLMLSSGGLSHVGEVKRAPVQMLESGPAAGALAAADIARAEGLDRVLAFDMGGTTAKLCLVDDGQPTVAYRFEAAREKRFAEGSGLPIRISTVELIEIGAGGGSLARLDDLGLLKVGSESAGAEPGPVAYGQGGTAPTVTDGDFMLGYLAAEGFAGGAIEVDLEACGRALGGLAAEAGLAAERLAWGIHDLVNENMASAARVHIAEKGRDPRRYVLVATGGAGPVHAYDLARKLGIRRLVCPRSAGVASALGLLIAPASVDRAMAFAGNLEAADWPALEAAFSALEAEARAVIAHTGSAAGAAGARVQRLADMRNLGQGFELVVALPEGPYDAAAGQGILAAYENGYQARFARPPPSVPVEFSTLRVRLSVPGAQAPRPATSDGGGTALKGHRSVYFPEAGGFIEAAVYHRAAMPAGQVHHGPALVEEAGSTLVVGPGGRFEISPAGNLIVELPEEEAA